MEEILIHQYQPSWPVYAMNFHTNPSKPLTLALGSFVKTQYNFLQIIALNQETKSFDVIGQVDQVYPATKLMWSPNPSSNLLASTGDSLKI